MSPRTVAAPSLNSAASPCDYAPSSLPTAPADAAGGRGNFHGRYGVPAHFPAPLALTDGDRRALDRYPVDVRCEEIARLAHDDFLTSFNWIGAFSSLDWKAEEAAWRSYAQSYLTAAFAAYLAAGEAA